ncbi:MAG: hypothetical protein RLY58_867 [Pseudomonadota bacterium]|jgi:uncharacterized membrane protein
MTLLRLLLSLSLWITSVVSMVALGLNGFSGSILLLAVMAWLLAYVCWPKKPHSAIRRRTHHSDWLSVDLIELIFTLIEWPIRAFFWLFRHLSHGLDGL